MSKFKIGDFLKCKEPKYLFLLEIESISSLQYTFKHCADPFLIEVVDLLYDLANEEDKERFLKECGELDLKRLTQNQSKIVCPECFNTQENFWSDDPCFELECTMCDKCFSVNREVEVTYSTSKIEQPDDV